MIQNFSVNESLGFMMVNGINSSMFINVNLPEISIVTQLLNYPLLKSHDEACFATE